jgi:hypothetical protein
LKVWARGRSARFCRKRSLREMEREISIAGAGGKTRCKAGGIEESKTSRGLRTLRKLRAVPQSLTRASNGATLEILCDQRNRSPKQRRALELRTLCCLRCWDESRAARYRSGRLDHRTRREIRGNKVFTSTKGLAFRVAGQTGCSHLCTPDRCLAFIERHRLPEVRSCLQGYTRLQCVSGH